MQPFHCGRILALCALALLPANAALSRKHVPRKTVPAAYSHSVRQGMQHKPLIVGWHDEFNTSQGWSPWTAGGKDILSQRYGALRVTLGNTSMFMKEFGHYRAGVWQDFDVDLNRYPLLAVRVTRFEAGSSWDINLFEYRDPNAPDARDITHGGGIPVPGNPQGLAADIVANSSGRYRAEMIFVDVQENTRRKPGKSHVRLLLNLSGPQKGAFADYAWARFIRREDVERMRNNPTSRNLPVVEE